MKKMSLALTLLSALAGLGKAGGNLFNAVAQPFRAGTGSRRTRTPGMPGQSGSKLARKAAEKRIGITHGTGNQTATSMNRLQRRKMKGA